MMNKKKKQSLLNSVQNKNCNKLILKIGNETIEESPAVEYLGILDNKLTFAEEGEIILGKWLAVSRF